MKKEIIGRVKYAPLEGGHWLIVSDNGKTYLPINMPTQYKADGCRVNVSAIVLEDVASIAMMGEVIRITRFETL